MTITNTTNSVTRIGNGATTSWGYTFIIPDSDSIIVQVIADYATNPVITVIDAADFTVTGLGESAGGTVTYPKSGTPIPATSKIQIIREVPVTQTVSVSNQTTRDAGVVQNVWDRLTMMIQDRTAALARTMKVAVGETGGSITVGAENTLAKWDANGNLIEGPTESNITASATAAANSAAAAASSATAAAASQTAAASSASAASTSEGNASTSEGNASSSATAAANSAAAAASSESNASDSETAAGTSATNAATSATSASTSASNASSNATSASTSATNASNSATAAATSATNAASSATSAATSATNASTSETNAASSASSAEGAAIAMAIALG